MYHINYQLEKYRMQFDFNHFQELKYVYIFNMYHAKNEYDFYDIKMILVFNLILTRIT